MKIGFIGIGNMSTAIINGINNKDSVIISARNLESSISKAKELGVHYANNHQDCVRKSDIIILGVKPEIMIDILHEIKDVIEDKTLVSIAAKLNLQTLIEAGETQNIVRVMPNLNVAIKQGTSALVAPASIDETHLKAITQIFEGIGSVDRIEESQMSGFIGLAGSLPAFVFKFIGAIAEECMNEGFTYEEAIKIASSAVSGSAQYLSQSGTNHQILTQRVCSPGGTTIEGVKSLDALEFDSIVMTSIRKVINKDKSGL